jgi:hypothetical protein
VLVAYCNSAAAADVDADGDTDLVIGTYIQRNHLLINDGVGHFTDETLGRLPALVTATANMVLVDVDRDADLDLLEGNRWNGAKLSLNDGRGRFTDATSRSLPAPPPDGWVAVGDVDRDGDVDAWFCGVGSGDRLFINDGSGRFTDETAARLPADPRQSQFALLVDLDGDGAVEAYLGKGYTDRLYQNDGTGHFTDVSTTSLPPSNAFAAGCAAGDVDGDGDADLMVEATWKGQPWLLLNDGAGQLANGMPLRLPERQRSDGYPNAIATGDVDGNGTLDLVMATATRGRPGELRVVLHLNEGNGEFRDASDRLPDTSRFESLGVALGDIDGDGDLDLVVAVWYGVARVFVNDGRGRFTEPAPDALPWLTASALALVDVDGDRDLDLVVAAQTARLWLNDGSGRFAEVTATHLPESAAQRMTTGDLDGDGDVDLVLAWLGWRNSILVNDGRGRFTDESLARLPAPNTGSWAVALADVDGDGDLDLAFGNYEQKQDQLYLNDGRGFFADVTATHMPADTDSAYDVRFGDLDGDGRPELVIGNLYGKSRVYGNDGRGHFRDLTPERLPDAVTQTHSVALADFDADGLLDVLFGNEVTDILYVNHLQRIVAPILPRPGYDYPLDYYVAPGFARAGGMVMQFMAARPAAPSLPIPPFGVWRLDPGTMFPLPLVAIPAPAGRATINQRVPLDRSLVGAGIFVQGIAHPTPDAGTWRFTNLLEDRIVR